MRKAGDVEVDRLVLPSMYRLRKVSIIIQLNSQAARKKRNSYMPHALHDGPHKQVIDHWASWPVYPESGATMQYQKNIVTISVP